MQLHDSLRRNMQPLKEQPGLPMIPTGMSQTECSVHYIVGRMIENECCRELMSIAIAISI